MKKQMATLSILAVAAIGCFAGVALLTKQSETTESESQTLPPVLGVEQQEITKIQWTTSQGESLALVHQTEQQEQTQQWTFPQNEQLPLSQTTAEQLAQTLAGLTPNRIFESPEQLQEYGLEQPTGEIVVETQSGTQTLQMGSQNTTTMDYYVRVKESGDVFTVSQNPAELLPNSESELIEIESLPYISLSSVSETKLNTPQGEFVLTQTQQEDGTAVWSGTLNGVPLTAESDEILAVVRDVLAFSYAECVNYAPQSLADYGLEQPLYTIQVKYTEQEQPKEFELYLGSQREDGAVYAMQKDGVQVGAVSESNYTLFTDAVLKILAE